MHISAATASKHSVFFLSYLEFCFNRSIPFLPSVLDFSLQTTSRTWFEWRSVSRFLIISQPLQIRELKHAKKHILVSWLTVTWRYRITELCLRTNEKNNPKGIFNQCTWKAPWGLIPCLSPFLSHWHATSSPPLHCATISLYTSRLEY